ncbi:MAG TPA: hypothetical protein VMS04_15675 [Vicinamibacterales bacterium]|nr:hypothetical protein [Vicinamibacterales bacterium]
MTNGRRWWWGALIPAVAGAVGVVWSIYEKVQTSAVRIERLEAADARHDDDIKQLREEMHALALREQPAKGR